MVTKKKKGAVLVTYLKTQPQSYVGIMKQSATLQSEEVIVNGIVTRNITLGEAHIS